MSDMIGFGSMVLASGATVLSGFIGDRIGRCLPGRCLLIVISFASAWNTLIVFGWLWSDRASLFISQMLLAIGVFGGAPLW
ncbi:unnamed protein product [Protopolystoma xenopodis]|uniref:Uncharacterized protein n=1 Tax=Protopolystoma xenopodis TaxID=117903 RepID=A0A3S5BV69_9PLAT|nr:unnamed protein product [Protopolystoma xenopodis]